MGNGGFKDYLYERKDEGFVASLEEEVRSLQSEIRDLRVVATIAMELVGQTPDRQRDAVGGYFESYINQNELPNARDLVRALMNIPRGK